MNNLAIINNLLRTKTAKFGFQLGIVAGTSYYISSLGVWRDSETTTNLYNDIKRNVTPYTQEVTKHIPYELPSLPASGEVSYLAKYYWNKGVMATFAFLANVPSHINNYSEKGLQAILDNTEVKNLVGLSSDSETKKNDV